MERQGHHAALILLVALSGCGDAPHRDKAPDARDLAVSARLTKESPPIEGELGVFEIRVKNSTPHYAVLRDLIPPGETAAALSWQVALPGRLTFEPGPDHWVWDRKAAGPERPVFNKGLLCPGEELTIRTRLRLLNLPRRFAIRYYVFRREDVGLFVYFEKKVESETRFVRLLGRDLEKALARSDTPGVASHRTVIFPHAEQVDALPQVQPLDLGADLIRRPFTAGQAAAKAGLASTDEVTYCATLDAWVLRSGKRAWLVTPKSATELPPIARLDPFFHLVDAASHAKIEVEFVKETARFFARDYPLVHDAGTNRVLLFLPKTDLPAFFATIRGNTEVSAKLDVLLNADGTGRILVSR